VKVVVSLSQGRTLVRSAACLHTNQSRSYLNYLVAVVAVSLDRHVGRNVAKRVGRCMPRQMLVCCVVSVLAAM